MPLKCSLHTEFRPLTKEEMEKLGGVIEGVVTLAGFNLHEMHWPVLDPRGGGVMATPLYVHPTLFDGMRQMAHVRVSLVDGQLMLDELGLGYGPPPKGAETRAADPVVMSTVPLNLVLELHRMVREGGEVGGREHFCMRRLACTGAKGESLEFGRTALVLVDGQYKLMCRRCCCELEKLDPRFVNPPKYGESGYDQFRRDKVPEKLVAGWELPPNTLVPSWNLPFTRIGVSREEK